MGFWEGEGKGGREGVSIGLILGVSKYGLEIFGMLFFLFCLISSRGIVL